MSDSIDKKIINILKEDIELSEEPFKIIAKQLNISEDEVIVRLKNLKESDVLKKIGIVSNYRDPTFKVNAMVVWSVDEKVVDQVGRMLASISEITNCCRREICEDWKYNLFTMIYSENRYDCEELIRNISNKIGIKKYKILYSTKELKKQYKYDNM